MFFIVGGLLVILAIIKPTLRKEGFQSGSMIIDHDRGVVCKTIKLNIVSNSSLLDMYTGNGDHIHATQTSKVLEMFKASYDKHECEDS